jgi:fructose/tagatose bisphosphate aldolase
LLTGSAQLTTSGQVSGYAIFRYNPNGQEAVVPIESRNASSYMVAFDNTGGTVTGLALSLSSAQNANVPVILRNDAGVQVGTSSISLNANGHTSFTVDAAHGYPAAANIRGTLEFATPAGAEISVLGIRSPPALTFTTLPALAK